MTKQTNMLKLMNSVLLLAILCGGLQLSHGEKLECEFDDDNYNPVGTLYQCKVTALDNSFNNMIIDGYTGVHETSKNDKDVKAIWIHGANLKYIPEGLGSLSNLLGLAIHSSQLVEIRSKDFQGMQNLDHLSLLGNKLTSVPLDAFSSLAKLIYIDLELNQIKYIGFGVFDQLTNLNRVDLRRNICVNKLYQGSSAITQMKHDIKVNCVGPISTSSTTTTTTTTTQNPVEVELEALKNEAKEQQQKNEIELKKLRNDLKKEQMENLKVNKEKDTLAKEKDELMINYDVLTQDKDALKMIIDTLLKEKDVWIKENYELKLKLNNKTTEINEICDTNCKPIEVENVKLNAINERLLKAFQNHQIEYLEIVKLKADLSTAKDQQKKEKETVELKEPKMIQLNVTDNLTLSNKCNSFTINCNFMDTNGTYTCETRNLFINQKEMELSKIIGTHMKSKSNEEVTELIIVKSSMFYWSNDIFIKFPALQTLKIQNAQLNELTKGDFSSASELRFLVVNGNNIKPLGEDVFHGTEHLTVINMNSNQIEEISTGTFRGLKQLRVLSLKDNLITEIPLGTFKDIVMLEILILTGNKIKFLDGKMLEFNKRLMTLAVDQNELREVGEGILDHSVELKDVNLEGNDCIDERTTIYDDDTDGRTINDLIFVIRNCCKNSAKALNVYNCGQKGSED